MSKTEIIEQDWGQAPNPLDVKNLNPVKHYTLVNENNIQVEVISLGATIKSILLPDRLGDAADVVLGYDSVEGYLRRENPYFGATVGRVANRIGHAKFTMNDHKYSLSANLNGKHHLHGGFIGFDRYNWESMKTDHSVVMKMIHRDGLEGYPGTVTANCSFELNKHDELIIHYSAVSTKDTPINLTNHSYFNLAGHNAGHQELYEHVVMINADEMTRTDSDSIPTGDMITLQGTEYDLRQPRNLGDAMAKINAPGFDNNYCINGGIHEMKLAAKVRHPDSGRTMIVKTDQPGVQFYTSNFLPDKNNMIYSDKKKLAKPLNDGEPIIGKGEELYEKHAAFCLETQYYPDAVNHVNFPSCILKAGDAYNHTVVYKFSVE